MKRIAVFAVFVLLFSVLIAAAQGPPKPTPAPELKKLDYFIGSWKTEGELKPGSMGPGSPAGKYSSLESCKWMSGHFFLVANSTTSGAMGQLVETAYFGYNTDEKAYTYDAFNSMGEAEHFKGNVEGDTWTWTSTEKMGGQTMKARFTLTIASPTSYTFKFEIAPENSSNYTTVVEGKSTKVVAAKAKGAEGGAAKK